MLCKILERANTCPKLASILMFTNALGYLVKTLHWQVIYNSILDAIPATQQLASWIVMLSSCYSLLLLRYQVDATYHQKRYTGGKYWTFPAQETVCESPPFLLTFPFPLWFLGRCPLKFQHLLDYYNFNSSPPNKSQKVLAWSTNLYSTLALYPDRSPEMYSTCWLLPSAWST